MKNQQTVSLQEWSALYDVANKFKRLQCWNWMYDSDLFGVQNPETGEIGYCCVMGQLGEVLALNLYPGPEGLDSYWQIHERSRLAEEGVSLNSHALLNTQKCLMASFEDRSELHQKDLGIIREVGLKFRGRKEWPIFRSYKPGFLPWFLTPPEAQFLAIALQQAIEVASTLRDNPHGLVPPEEEEPYLVRVLEGAVWKNTWQSPAQYKAPPTTPVINEVLLAQLKQSNFPRQGTWVTDCILLPVVIEEGERPYYPHGFPILSSEGMVCSMELLKPGEIEKELPNKFMEFLRNAKVLPQSLLVGSEQAFELLEPIAKKLTISIQQEEDHPALEFFLNGMESFCGVPR